MKYVYHGSPIPNLKIIQAKESTHMKKWVYACTSKAISTIFLSQLGNDLYYSLSGDGIDYQVELVERKKGMFKHIFNCSGYIYKVDASNFKNEAGLIKLYLYPERPNRIPQDNSDLIPKVIRWQKNGFDVNKFYKLYPELKDKFLQTLNE